MREDRLAFFVGAGVSYSEAQLPSGMELAKQLVQELGGSEEISTLAAAASRFEEERDRVELFNKVREILRFKGNITDEIICPSYKLLARLPLNTIITTNFDDLIERSFAHERVDLRAYSRNKLLADFIPNQRKLLKIHGDFTCAADEIVLTEDDYSNYAKNFSLFCGKLNYIFETDVVVFVGYSLEDPNFKNIYESVFAKLSNLKLKSYAVVKSELPKSVRNFWLDKKIEILVSTAREFIQELSRTYQTEASNLTTERRSTKVVRGRKLLRPQFNSPNSPCSIRKSFAYFISRQKKLLVIQEYGFCVIDTMQDSTEISDSGGKISREVFQKSQEIGQRLGQMGFYPRILQPLDSLPTRTRSLRIQDADFCILLISSLSYEPVLNKLYGPVASAKPIILIVHENLKKKLTEDMVFPGLINCGATLNVFTRKELLTCEVWKNLAQNLVKLRDDWLIRTVRGTPSKNTEAPPPVGLLNFDALLTIAFLFQYRRVIDARLSELLGMSLIELERHLVALESSNLIRRARGAFEMKSLGRKIAATLELYRFDFSSSERAYDPPSGRFGKKSGWDNNRVYIPDVISD